jgi:hypothetical protein
LHDILDIESRGIPGGYVASIEFEEATRAQGLALGYEPAVVYVQHPIQDRTDEEMNQLADQAAAAVIALIKV